MLHFQTWKLVLVLGIVIAAILYALPNVFPRATMEQVPTWLPHKQVNLGLDLQGGAHLLYQLDEKEMTDDWLSTIRGDVRETLRRARIGYNGLSQDVTARSHRLQRPFAGCPRALALGEDPRRCRTRQGLSGAAQACRAGRRQRVLR